MKRKILHAIGCLGIGGAELQVLQIVRHADRDRYAFGVVAAHGPDDLAAEMEAAGAEVRILGGKGGLTDRASVAKTAKLLRDGGYELLHGHVKGCYYGRFAALQCGIPAIIHEQNPLWTKPKHYLPLDRMLLPWTARVLCVSETIQRQTTDLWGRTSPKAMLFPNTVFAERIEQSSQSPAEVRAGMPEGGWMLLCVGRLADQKAHWIAIKAMKAIAEAHPTARLVIVGDGPLRGELEALRASEGLEGHVVFTGAMQNVGDYLRAADLFLLPSVFEGQALALMEAMWCGLPVVCSKVDGANEAIVHAENGWLVPPGDPGALAQQVIKVLAQPARAKNVAAKGQAYAQAHAGIGSYIERLQGVYEEVLPHPK